jgi:MoxR-like ATPase
MIGGISSRILEQTRKVVVGREEETRLILECFLARGHVLLEGVPGISKTLLAKAFAKSLGLEFKRVQFTPDMLPLDIVGGFIYNQAKNSFEFRKGPVFTNILLADEVNRAPPKVQSALLEAMQELQVTVEGHTELLPSPMIVLGTENPVEFQGVYPLPEGQLDRFTMRVVFSYQPTEVETDVLQRNLGDFDFGEVEAVVGKSELQELIQEVQKTTVTREMLGYLVKLGQEMRADPRLDLGPSPRALVQLLHCAQARAALEGRSYIIPDDIKARSEVVLAHRLRLTREASLKGLAKDPSKVIAETLGKVEPPR